MTTSSGSRPISTSRTTYSPASKPSPAAAPGRRVTRMLGIAPGSRATGYGLIVSDGGSARCERSGVFAPRAALPFAERLLRIHDALAALLTETAPDEVAVE